MTFNISTDIEFTGEVHFTKNKWYWRLAGYDNMNSKIKIDIESKIPFDTGKDAQKDMDEFISVNCLNLGN